MTKAEVFEKAWRLGFKGDFSLVDEIFQIIKLLTIDLELKQILIQIKQSFLLFLTVSKLALSERSTKVKNSYAFIDIRNC